MTNEELLAKIQALEAVNAELAAKAAKASGQGLKVSAKGAVSLYGLGRFPVTLYASQWEKLFTKQDEVKAFIQENLAKLAVKE